jgi:catechol 2,3-dioxygenase-like lactoylglutathione lyase family enzyme
VLDFRLESRGQQEGDTISRVLGVPETRVATARLRLGRERIELIDFLNDVGRPIPADSRSNDRWFQHIAIVVSDMDRAYERLETAGVRAASLAPQTLPAWNPVAGGIRAYYFKDPDDHVLEIIQFPWPWPRGGESPDTAGSTGDSPSAPVDPLFLGIDHTAIVTADTDRSLMFYQNVLGLRIAGESSNYGVEQERLNNVFGAHLRITTLRATSGPGIELLEYLTPTTGRDMPRDSTAADHWHWHVTVTAAAPLQEAVATLARARAPRISAAPASPDVPLPAVIARDPDGHAVQVVPAAPQP